MAKRRKGRKPSLTLPRLAFKFPKVELAAQHKRVIGAIAAFAFAWIILLSYLDLAGPAGLLLNEALLLVLGSSRWLLILFFVAWAGVLLKKHPAEREFYLAEFLGIFLILLAFLGGIDLFSSGAAGVLGEWAGALEFWFGFWASLVILSASAFIGMVLAFWASLESLWERARQRKQLLPVKLEKPSLAVINLPEESLRGKPNLTAAVKELAPEKKAAEPEFSLRKTKIFSGWELPPLELLDPDGAGPTAGDIKVSSQIIQRTLEDFGIPVEMGDVNVGPTVTQYTLKPAQGIKLARILALQNDLALALAAHPIRIEAPIPGKSLVGIEVPNKVSSLVRLRKILEPAEFRADQRPLLFAMGRDVMGKSVINDLARLPHLLVAGATGSGKSIFIHSFLVSLLYRNPPRLLKLILVDPKRVELTAYDEIPYLLSPVITEGKKAILALKWAVAEMERRYGLLLEEKSRDILSFNAKVSKNPEKILPYIVIVIDELADLMSVYGKELEGIIIRLSQMARATGIHLVVSTQRPSVEVITGLIKANITSRIAFQVASQIDSRTILDVAGAEKLLGKGDLLFVSADTSKPRRCQSPYVSEHEVEKVVGFIKATAEKMIAPENREPSELEAMITGLEAAPEESSWLLDDEDELYNQAYQIVVEAQKASTSYLQRRLRIGYARAARLLDLLESRGVVGPGQGAKSREVYHTKDEAGNSPTGANL